MGLCAKSCAVRKTRIGLFLAACLGAGCALVFPHSADAKPLGPASLEAGHQSQSRLIKIPKVRRAQKLNRKVAGAPMRPRVPVHSPACTELPPVPDYADFAPPTLDDDDDDVVLADTAAVDTEKRALVKEGPFVQLEPKAYRARDPKPRLLALERRPSAVLIRVRLLPKLPDSSEDGASA
jgi:hypothetical protein